VALSAASKVYWGYTNTDITIAATTTGTGADMVERSLVGTHCFVFSLAAVIQRLLALFVARRLIQDGQDTADQQAEGVAGSESVQHLDHLCDLF
jgi:hypothetical protein